MSIFKKKLEKEFLTPEVKRYIEVDQYEFLEGLTKIIIEKAIEKEEEKPFAKDFLDEEVIIALYKDKTMDSTRQLMYGHPAIIIASVLSALDNLIDRGIIKDKRIRKDIDKLRYDLVGDLSEEE